eukprot:m.49174 g.49174  ORF g.49174 m.49174 type:complete len:706 (-) comp12055_c0_seq2:41-2158(-)
MASGSTALAVAAGAAGVALSAYVLLELDRPANGRLREMVGGLINEGETCFANCVLQALASLPALHAFLEQAASYRCHQQQQQRHRHGHRRNDHQQEQWLDNPRLLVLHRALRELLLLLNARHPFVHSHSARPVVRAVCRGPPANWANVSATACVSATTTPATKTADNGKSSDRGEGNGVSVGPKGGAAAASGWSWRSLFAKVGGVQSSAPRFRGGGQQDAHEFLHALLDMLCEEATQAQRTTLPLAAGGAILLGGADGECHEDEAGNQAPSPTPTPPTTATPPPPTTTATPTATAAIRVIRQPGLPPAVLPPCTALASAPFRGETASSWRCTSCGTESTCRLSSFSSLTLSTSSVNHSSGGAVRPSTGSLMLGQRPMARSAVVNATMSAATLETLLARYASPEVVEGVRCDQCGLKEALHGLDAALLAASTPHGTARARCAVVQVVARLNRNTRAQCLPWVSEATRHIILGSTSVVHDTTHCANNSSASNISCSASTSASSSASATAAGCDGGVAANAEADASVDPSRPGHPADRCTCLAEQPESVLRTVQRSTRIAKAPRVLSIQIANVGFGPTGMTKRHAPVRFPERLVLPPQALSSPPASPRTMHRPSADCKLPTIAPPTISPPAQVHTPPVYKLQAVVAHHGTADNGHYLTYRRLPPREGFTSSARWVLASDECVRPVPLEKVLSANPTLLFYHAIGEEPL